MVKDMKLEEFANRKPTFKPYARYCRESDCLEIFIGGDDAFAERVDDVLTVYWSEDQDDSLMGCEIHGVRALVRAAAAVGIEIAREGKLQLSALLAAYQGLHPDRIPVRNYEKLMRVAKQMVQTVHLDGA
jgi:hypothetical protein